MGGQRRERRRGERRQRFNFLFGGKAEKKD
jgi:hypothetical protein